YSLPDAPLRPAVIAVVHRHRWPVCRRTILPAAAGLQNMDDPADDAPVVLALGPVCFVGKCGSRTDHCKSSSQNTLFDFALFIVMRHLLRSHNHCIINDLSIQ